MLDNILAWQLQEKNREERRTDGLTFDESCSDTDHWAPRQPGTKPCEKWKADPWTDSVNRRTLEWCVVANIYIYGLEQDQTALWLL